MGASEVTDPRTSGPDEIDRGGVSDLQTVAEGLLRDAHHQPARRAARTIIASTSMRTTVIALLAGAEMNEHVSPPVASLQVITGDVRLTVGDTEQPVRAGEIVRIPAQRHGLVADTDAVVLLTVALH